MEVPDPVISDDTQARNLTNEGGYAGTIRLLRNVAGLWLLQACRRVWAAEGRDYTYPELVAMADEAAGLNAIVNPDAPEFLDGRDAPRRMQAYCRSYGQHGPAEPRRDRPLRRGFLGPQLPRRRRRPRRGDRPRDFSVNIVGGGSNNALLAQLTADATGLPVHCGPVEATALGNAATQLVALGELADLADIRRVIVGTTDITSYAPTASTDRWDDAYAHFTRLLARDRERLDLAVES